MNIFITGGSGYVGSKLVEMLVETTKHYVTVYETQIFGNPIKHLASPRVNFVEGDILNLAKLKTAMFRAECVIHLAGVVTDELVDMNPTYGRKVNVQGTRNVVKACEYNNVRKLIFASSSSVYGETAAEVVPNETHIPQPTTEYAKQKLEGEAIVMNYMDEIHCATAVRQATAMGPAPRMRLDTVVNIFSKQAWFDGVITPFGGKQYRSNVHVADAARFYITLAEADNDLINGHIWNLTDENLPVREIAWRVAEAAKMRGREVDIEIKDVEDTRSYRLDASKIHHQLNFETERSVAAAAGDNFDFFEKSDFKPDNDIYYNNKRMAEVVKPSFPENEGT
jgi:nucleoside-diphosphate-sugar epimerase